MSNKELFDSNQQNRNEDSNKFYTVKDRYLVVNCSNGDWHICDTERSVKEFIEECWKEGDELEANRDVLVFFRNKFRKFNIEINERYTISFQEELA